jgi:hypothetical protein
MGVPEIHEILILKRGVPRVLKQYWVVRHRGNRLGRDGRWELDRPRTDEWIKEHSFESIEEAYGVLSRCEEWRTFDKDGKLIADHRKGVG